MEDFWTEADIISRYTRREAIEDGTLVDVSGISTLPEEAGIVLPLAMTRDSWETCVSWEPADSRRVNRYQNEDGRLWDVLVSFRNAAKANGSLSEVRFSLSIISIENGELIEQELVGVCGPGDSGEPVLTIMLPGED